jgi:hypothetical protein
MMLAACWSGMLSALVQATSADSAWFVQDPLMLWGLTDKRRYFPPTAAASAYLAASAASQLLSGYAAGAESLLYEHARELPYLIR